MAEEKEYVVNIIDIKQITHDVRRFRFDKPQDFKFTPGNATEVSINKPEWKNEKRPFTFTCLNDESYLEFTIKIYDDHDGVTNQLGKLKVGDQLIIRDPWGTIHYEDKGVFIAGGAGITPFIAILRQLKKDKKTKGNTLIFANKTEADIILKDELKSILGDDCIFILSQEKKEGYGFGRVDEAYLRSKIRDFKQNFYICGPPPMVLNLQKILPKLGADIKSIVFEK